MPTTTVGSQKSKSKNYFHSHLEHFDQHHFLSLKWWPLFLPASQPDDNLKRAQLLALQRFCFWSRVVEHLVCEWNQLVRRKNNRQKMMETWVHSVLKLLNVSLLFLLFKTVRNKVKSWNQKIFLFLWSPRSLIWLSSLTGPYFKSFASPS